jgi:hypothetical protein
LTPEIIKNFSEQMIFNSCTQAGYLNTQTINPSEQIKELYEKIILEKDLIIQEHKVLLGIKSDLKKNTRK